MCAVSESDKQRFKNPSKFFFSQEKIFSKKKNDRRAGDHSKIPGASGRSFQRDYLPRG
jgi:hypothetical protein